MFTTLYGGGRWIDAFPLQSISVPSSAAMDCEPFGLGGRSAGKSIFDRILPTSRKSQARRSRLQNFSSNYPLAVRPLGRMVTTTVRFAHGHRVSESPAFPTFRAMDPARSSTFLGRYPET